MNPLRSLAAQFRTLGWPEKLAALLGGLCVLALAVAVLFVVVLTIIDSPALPDFR